MYKLIKMNFLSDKESTFEKMVQISKANLFKKIISNEEHVFCQFLLPKKKNKYSLCPRAHCYQLPINYYLGFDCVSLWRKTNIVYVPELIATNSLSIIIWAFIALVFERRIRYGFDCLISCALCFIRIRHLLKTWCFNTEHSSVSIGVICDASFLTGRSFP